MGSTFPPPASLGARVLLADADLVSRMLIEQMLVSEGYNVETVANGSVALERLRAPDRPPMAILDWELPSLGGVDVCRQLRTDDPKGGQYVVLLSVRDTHSDRIHALHSGANDFLARPFDLEELAARLQVAAAFVNLQRKLAERVVELEAALAQVRTLKGLLPICAWCRRVRDDENYWRQMEEYVATHTEARFTHGICPQCSTEIEKED